MSKHPQRQKNANMENSAIGETDFEPVSENREDTPKKSDGAKNQQKYPYRKIVERHLMPRRSLFSQKDPTRACQLGQKRELSETNSNSSMNGNYKLEFKPTRLRGGQDIQENNVGGATSHNGKMKLRSTKSAIKDKLPEYVDLTSNLCKRQLFIQITREDLVPSRYLPQEEMAANIEHAKREDVPARQRKALGDVQQQEDLAKSKPPQVLRRTTTNSNPKYV